MAWETGRDVKASQLYTAFRIGAISLPTFHQSMPLLINLELQILGETSIVPIQLQEQNISERERILMIIDMKE